MISYRSIETVRGYKPPLDVEERLQALTEQVYNDELDDHGDWRTQPLHDRFKKYKVQFSGVKFNPPSFFVLKILSAGFAQA